jgi:hypothetical protein
MWRLKSLPSCRVHPIPWYRRADSIRNVSRHGSTLLQAYVWHNLWTRLISIGNGPLQGRENHGRENHDDKLAKGRTRCVRGKC